MASIRDLILTELVTRVDAITGVSAALRSDENTVDSDVHAIVYPIGEDKSLDTGQSYNATYRVEVLLIALVGNADPDMDGSNAYRYLDRMVTEVEKVIHVPDAWGPAAPVTDVWIQGHDVVEPDEENEIAARISLTFKYRHDYRDPAI